MVRWVELPIGRAAAVNGGLALLLGAATAFAQDGGGGAAQPEASPSFTIIELFTYLFVTIGPLKVMGPFLKMSAGFDPASRRKLAVQAIVIAAFALLAAATVGAGLLAKWGVSVGALLFTAGVVLFLVALRSVLSQYDPEHAPAADHDGGPPTVSKVAFMPLAFPTIVTPYGIAIVIIAVTLTSGREGSAPMILGLVGAILVLDLLAMLAARAILGNALVRTVLGILGTMLGVIQVALGVQAAVAGLRLLGVVGPAPR